jgi:hypothetical protein
MLTIGLNPHRRLEILHVGDEETPVIIVDDVVESPDELIAYAVHHAEFSDTGVQGYPGIRAKLPDSYVVAVKPLLHQLVSEQYTPLDGHDLRVVQQLFSLVTRPPENLELLQRVPHYDDHSPYYFATVHYLNHGNFAGTGIFRHRPTGFESITRARHDIFLREAREHIRRHGMPAASYINTSDDHFELIRELEYRPNRLVMYPGYLLHSGLIDPLRDISADPARGRLTANLFFMPLRIAR